MKRISLFCFTMILLLSSIPSMEIKAAPKWDEPEGMTRVAGNEYLTLFLDEEETDIAVMDNQTGKIWYSNPVDVDTDEKASNYYKRVMKSQLQVQYYNESVQASVMDNYNDAIMNGQFSIEKLEDGVRIDYSLGATTSTLLLPDAIAADRMEMLLAKMNEKAVKKMNRNYTAVVWADLKSSEQKTYAETYPGYEGMDFYILRGGVKDYLKEELSGYFEEAGYTMDDLLADKVASGAADAENTKPWFQIPLTYRLEEDNLVVSVDPTQITYNQEGYYLVDIDILPYFGAAREQEGYIFVPDGSGALIYLDNGKNLYTAYTSNVYGGDRAKQVLNEVKPEIEESLVVKIPVFGLKADDQAFFAVIERGDGYADISADVSGRTGSYNHVNAGFSYLQYGPAALSDMVGSNLYQLYGPAQFEDIYQIRYSFLTGEKANYSGMACCYREYLEKKGVLNPITETKEVPFFTEYIGAIDKYKTILGVKYRALEVLTSYDEAKEISEQLHEAGIYNQNVIYTGWMNGGLHGTANTRLQKLSQLEKNGMKLQQFQNEMDAIDAKTYMTVDMQYVYQDKFFDGYSKLQYAPGYFDHTEIVVPEYAVSDQEREGEMANLISPYHSAYVTEKINKFFTKNEIKGINLGTASWELYSDYLENQYTDRQMAILRYQQDFDTLKQSVGAVLGDNSNAYSWSYTDALINAPLSSNRYQILDEDIPFYEMVLHGYIEYAGEALNMCDDYQTTLLKSVESGAGLHFKWIYQDNSVLKETEYESLYSVQYSKWIERAIEDYHRVNDVLSDLTNCRIVNHERNHDVSKVTYSDNSVIYVNFGKEATVVDEIEIGARDFAVRKGCE